MFIGINGLIQSSVSRAQNRQLESAGCCCWFRNIRKCGENTFLGTYNLEIGRVSTRSKLTEREWDSNIIQQLLMRVIFKIKCAEGPADHARLQRRARQADFGVRLRKRLRCAATTESWRQISRRLVANVVDHYATHLGQVVLVRPAPVLACLGVVEYHWPRIGCKHRQF